MNDKVETTDFSKLFFKLGNRVIILIIVLITIAILIMGFSIYNSYTQNLERIKLQDYLFQTIRSFDEFRWSTKRLLSEVPLEESYGQWLTDKEDFIFKFESFAQQPGIADLPNVLSIYKSVLKSAESKIGILEYHIDGIRRENPEWMNFPLMSQVDRNEYQAFMIAQAIDSINILNSLLSNTFKNFMDDIYRDMTRQQEQKLETRTFLTILVTSSITLSVFLILLYVFQAYRRSKMEHLDKTNLALNVTLEVLAYQVELRDNSTGYHLNRTSKYVKMIALRMAELDGYKKYLTPSYINDLERVSVLHDIGKVAVPDSILQNPGKLTKEEFEIVKRHPKDGADTLRIALKRLPFESFLDIAVKLTESHHEYWNGEGYPYGLSGEEIPLSGRIMAIADVYDALRSKRSYKDKFSHEECLEYLLHMKGVQFDPACVEAFLSIEDDIRKISEEL